MANENENSIEIALWLMYTERLLRSVPSWKPNKPSGLNVCFVKVFQYYQIDIIHFRLKSTDIEEFRRKILLMAQRIRELEDALAIVQSRLSSEKHPLLREDLLLIKQIPETQPHVESEASDDPLAESVHAFGTLTIDDGGESKYFGPSAGSEVCYSSALLRRFIAYTLFESSDIVLGERAF